ncbi:MAG: hypothetical protein AABO57_05135 [Acidobacteriota bacterium]
MAYLFHEVNFYIFDVHTVLKPLRSSGCLQPAFSFLNNEAEYRNQYDKSKVVQTASFNVHPLTKRSLIHNHFWKRYKDIWLAGSKPDYWKLQLPFVCQPRNTKVRLDAGVTALRGSVRPVVFLSAVGWSSNLYIHLSGDIDPGQLIELTGKLDRGEAVFQVNGKNKSIVEIFKLFAGQLGREIYLPDCSPVDTQSISRYLITSVARFSGPLMYYRSRSGATTDMADTDRALMLSILRGRPLNLADWAAETNDKKFSLTYSDKRPDFGLIDFRRAALLFMQEAASKNGQGKLRCYGSNVRLCYLMVMALVEFYRDSETDAATSSQINSLRENIKGTLKQLPKVYKPNKFCEALYSNHKALRKIVA